MAEGERMADRRELPLCSEAASELLREALPSCELPGVERGGPLFLTGSSKQVVHGVGSPSVTMSGVGPWWSQ